VWPENCRRDAGATRRTALNSAAHAFTGGTLALKQGRGTFVTYLGYRVEFIFPSYALRARQSQAREPARKITAQ